MSAHTVWFWVEKFKSGRVNVHNDAEIGKLREVRNENYGVNLRPWSKWTVNSDKKLSVNKPRITSRKTAFRLQKRHLAGTCTAHIPPCKFSKYFTKFFKIQFEIF